MSLNIRQRTIENEGILLCELACRSADAQGQRAVFEPPCDIRTEFQRDRDRIIHSSAFRRLKRKTQVFLFPKSDHYRTRLTHTLEVAQIARTISRALRLNEDLTEAIALGHDLGHTPFGHDGERVLNRLFHGGFKHNEQGVRVVEIIERGGLGLNLTAEVRDGILNHSSKSKAATREGDVVRLADKIAYINHDIEDAVHSGVLCPEELPLSTVRILGDTKSKRITTLITSVVNHGCELVDYDDEVRQAHDELRAFMFERVYNNPRINGAKEKTIRVMEFLYNHYTRNQQLIPEFYQSLARKYGSERAVCDYISGMSDDFALDRFIEFCLPTSEEISGGYYATKIT
jgi:dGTPase